jgi:hypothetical protein
MQEIILTLDTQLGIPYQRFAVLVTNNVSYGKEVIVGTNIWI